MNRYDKKSDQYYLLKEFGWLTKIKFSNIPNKETCLTFLRFSIDIFVK